MAEDGERREDAGLRDGYEQLRAAVLSGGTSGWRLGHGVLCARGMTAWMHTFGELAGPAPAAAAAAAPSSSERPRSRPGQAVPLPDADQVVAVLAQMVLPLAA